MPNGSATIPITEDAYISGGANVASNYGTQTVITVGNVFSGMNNTCRGILRADLSGIPAFSEILTATLHFTRSGSGTLSGAADFYCRRLTTLGWEESTVTYNTIDGSTAWSSAGASSDYTLTNQATVNVPVSGSTIEFDIKDQVQDSHDLLVNHNLILMGPEATGTNDFIAPCSSDNGTSNNRPYLAVTYTYYPVIERIARCIRYRLSQVTEANNYTLDLSPVRPPRRGIANLCHGKAAVAQAPEASRAPEHDLPGNPPAVAWRQEVVITITVAAEDDDVTPVDTIGNLVAADAELAITTETLTSSDWSQFEGLALYTQQVGRDIQNTGETSTVTLRYEITYRHAENNPYTVR